jgi:hypothetical protein
MKIKFNILLVLILFCQLSKAEEGMYPLNKVQDIPLKKLGFQIESNDIYDGYNSGLIQAIVQIGGCTGSFISKTGLIITNHHCAFGGLEPYSTPENNLLEKGFAAENSKGEIQFKGQTAKIMKSFEDVSAEVLLGTDTIVNIERKKLMIAKNIASIKDNDRIKNPKLLIDIVEMIPSKTYLLYRYLVIKDLRIVLIPARNIGEFGGESDNWAWPRHTGDFSLLRAYVGKDGNPADYNTENIPYRPEEYLSINIKDLKENDDLFILGYPGKTYRHLSSSFINYVVKYQMPYTAQLNEWIISTTKLLGEDDEKWLISKEPKIKYLANVAKNYRGKLKTIRQIDLITKKLDQEKYILSVLKTPSRQNTFIKSKNGIDSIYNLIENNCIKSIWYNNLFTESPLVALYRIYINFGIDFNKLESESDRKVLIKNYQQKINAQIALIYPAFDSLYLRKMISDEQTFSPSNRVPVYNSLIKNVKEQNSLSKILFKAFFRNKLIDSVYVNNVLEHNPISIIKSNDVIFNWVKLILPDYLKTDSTQSALKMSLESKMVDYWNAKIEAYGKDFIPDANRTLRFTYGKIKGYSPNDATVYLPFTGALGMLEKDGTQEDYKINYDIAEILRRNGFGAYKLNGKPDVPLCFLYNTDTTGGNSGSPVLNSKGQLIGVNFDRTFEATVNDFAWDDSYSRSIGVDMKFVLWEITKVQKLDYLTQELSIFDK